MSTLLTAPFKRQLLAAALSTCIALPAVAATDETDAPTNAELQQRIAELEKALDLRFNALADTLEQKESSSAKQVHIGGYGEMHYANLNTDGVEERELDFHRMVLFFGYDFNDRIRFVTEFEVEHLLVSAGSQGAVEIEQAYIEMDLKDNLKFRSGVMLMPIGIVNETHEPPTFYGVERPIIETTIIPSTWYSAGISLTHSLDNGVSYDIMLSEGLKTEDPTFDSSAEPFNLKAGKQKGSFADAFDLAVTARIAYRGITGLELAAYAQYQPDLDQSAEISYADSATLVGGHVKYQVGNITTTALYSRWDLAGEQAKAAEQDVQDGGYVEMSWRADQAWGIFGRHSVWSQTTDQSATQSDVGINYYPHPDVVFKADYQIQNEDAGNSDGFHLGMGYQF